MPNYVTVAEANTYIATFKLPINRVPWDDATENDKTIAITNATVSIDNLNFSGIKADVNQVNQFPRVAESLMVGSTLPPTPDTIVPQKIKDACVEIALAFLDDIQIDIEIDNLNVRNFSYSDAKATYAGAGVSAHLVAGIPNNTAWRLLLPFLRDTRGIKLSRV